MDKERFRSHPDSERRRGASDPLHVQLHAHLLVSPAVLEVELPRFGKMTAPSAPTRSTRNRIRNGLLPNLRRRRGAHIPPRINAFPWVWRYGRRSRRPPHLNADRPWSFVVHRASPPDRASMRFWSESVTAHRPTRPWPAATAVTTVRNSRAVADPRLQALHRFHIMSVDV